jgi:hypothetical protein
MILTDHTELLIFKCFGLDHIVVILSSFNIYKFNLNH